MTTARDIMTAGADVLSPDTTVIDAAKKLASEDYGSIPICDGDRLQGIVTDRDIVVKVLAAGKDPATTKVIDLTKDQGELVTIGADDPIEEITRTMSEHQVRRLPVIDGHRLVGMVAQADLARTGQDAETGETVESISR
ncbi:MAG TPA: CBS domain-containing protein [Mycobacteriales bacterium]|nr:CBS domain-containing protein [Mycobacteriales bacterium]